MSAHFDTALLRKYDRPAPRYTSYPTALQFSAEASREALLAELGAGEGPLSLYAHLPFCESLCWFCACSTFITRNRESADPYIAALEREMDIYLPLIKEGRQVEQLHFGGGSPNFFTPDRLDRVCAAIRERFSFTSDAELSVELEPRLLEIEHLDILRNHGFNRASIGIQDSDPAVQEAIHRVQPVEMNLRVMGWLRERGFNSVNVDLMYGLPGQTPESYARTLDHVLSLEPDRVAVFSYAHVPWMKPAQKNLLRAGPLPGAEEKFALLNLAVERLTGAGYVFIGLDHFARPDDELCKAQREGTMQRNFQGYSTRAGAEMLAVGVTSIAQTRRSYRQNYHSLEKYYEEIAAGRLPVERGVLLSEDDLLRRTVIMRVMCDVSLDYAAMSALAGVDFKTHFAPELAAMDEMEADGLLKRHEDRLEITPIGRLLVRNIAILFDRHFKSGEKRHSRSV
ncbi:MAG: oxygen-independent coproporphyrinogen III oxidase [Opitutales bacterium]|nr:oxygen-independent coproporphyrinogen III oxidase [Opitutales bacterium]